jgi:hypothetical protein
VLEKDGNYLADRVKCEEVLHGLKRERHILHTIKRRDATWVGLISCRNSLLKHAIIEGMIENTDR